MSKRVEFALSTTEHQALTRLAKQRGDTAAAVMREALQEKLDRDMLMARVNALAERMDGVVSQMKEEVLRVRDDLIQDQMSAFGAMRDDIDRACAEIAESVRRNEDVNRHFLMALAGVPKRGADPRAGVYYPE